jgi:hypothetical protein
LLEIHNDNSMSHKSGVSIIYNASYI